MQNLWIISKRELGVFFNALTGYILLGVFLLISGFFTWLFGSDIFFRGVASLSVFFEVAYWSLFFFIPALTMRMFSEELRSGTWEQLITKPVTDGEVIAGKFLACWLVVLFSLLLTLPWYFTVAWLGPVDHGGTIGGYVALLLIGAAYIGIGLFASSLTRNQMVAFLIALGIGLFFQILFYIMYVSTSGYVAHLFYFLSFNMHYDALSRGVFDSRNIIYLISVAVSGLYFARIVLSIRNFR